MTGVEDGAVRAECSRCGRTFDVPGDSPTILTGAAPQRSVTREAVPLDALSQDAPLELGEEAGSVQAEAEGPPVHAICPACGAVMPIEAGKPHVKCPRCGKTYPMLGHPAQAAPKPVPSVADQATILSHEDSPAQANVPGVVAKIESAQGIEVEVVKDDGLQVKASAAAGAPVQAVEGRGPADTTITQAGGLDWLRGKLGDKYEVLDFLGRGGMGAVYKARQKSPSRLVALKVMLGGALASEKARKRFEREAQAAANVRHPCIVPVFEVGEVEGQPYFTMEFVEGQELGRYVRQNRLDRAAVCRLMVDICMAVDFAHTRGVIHRDLKPGNIMVDKQGHVRILDFGLARIAREDSPAMSMLTMSGDVMGTPRYMSPEQALAKPGEIDGRTDVYSLGVVFYELIVGIPPYNIEGLQGLRAYEVLMKAEPIRPSEIHPLISRDLEAILLKALEKDKRRRYRTALALAQDIESFLADRPVTAQAATTVYRTKKFIWRNRRIIFPVLGFLFVLTLVAGILTGLWLGTAGAKDTADRDLLKKVGGLKNMRSYVVNKATEGEWLGAYELAHVAEEEFWRDDPLTAGLVGEVRQMAKEDVDKRVDGLHKLIRAQKYDDAQQMAEGLGALALQIRFNKDAQQKAEQESKAFAETCWADLSEVLDKAHVYTRQDCVAALEKYIARFGDGPHAAAAREKLEQVKKADDAFFLGRQVEAVGREMDGCNWPAANEILAQAQGAVAQANVPDREEWMRRFAALRAKIDEVIWTGTVGRFPVIRALEGHTAYGKCVAFRPGSTPLQLATGSLDKTVRLWSCADGAQLKLLEATDEVRPVAFSHDGRLLAAACKDGSAHLWDLQQDAHVTWATGHSMRADTLAFSPDDKLLVTASPDSVKFWDIGQKEPKVVREFPRAREPLAISSQSGMMAALLQDGGIGLWNLDSEKPVLTISVESPPMSLAFSPDGKLLAGGCKDNSVRIWGVKAGTLLHTLAGHKRDPATIAFSRDGRLLASGGRGEIMQDGIVILWDLAGTPGQPAALKMVELPDYCVYALAFSPDCRLLAVSGNSREVRLMGVSGGHKPR